MSKIIRSLLMLFFSWLCVSSQAQIIKADLSGSWQFKQTNTANWQQAKVPGTVQEDLRRLGQIPAPFWANQEAEIQWIENESWTYERSFELSEAQLSLRHQELHFKGLDTYATVYLNHKKVLEADNMFRTWIVDVSSLLQSQNTLSITFHSPIKKGKAALDKLTYKPPAGNDVGEIKVSPVVRKAAYHFGWDWGPRIVTMGIWQPIELVSYQQNSLKDVFVKQDKLSDEIAELTTNIQLAKPAEKLTAKLFVNGELIAKQKLTKDRLNHQIHFKIKKPQRWNPVHQPGKTAYLYDIDIQLYQKGKQIDNQQKKLGLRTVELVNKPDETGTSFYFKVNGKPIFAKGANYIPQSHFINAKTEEDYKDLLQDAVDANMNMLRVWGGGIYENDIFYELCDEMGILVWQDFMFANTMYQGDQKFLENIKAEVNDNIVRLRQHPSIIHWCGNNEVNVAWHNWGWQKQYNYNKKTQKRLYSNYEKIFKELIPEQLETLLPGAAYSHTSPLSNWGTPENFNHSSMHYWGVFHGDDPFSEYANNVGRFNSEYGFQSLPTWNTIQSFLPDSEQKRDSRILDTRQKSYKGNKLMFRHLKRHFNDTDDLKTLSYLTQLTQALGIGYAIEQHRIQQPHCMGTLYWQLNDCWPAISWSSRDASGEWRALHYRVKEAFANTAVFIEDKEKLEVVIIKDQEQIIENELEVFLFDFYGNIIAKEKLPVKLNKTVNRIDISDFRDFVNKGNKSSLVLHVRFPFGNTSSEKLHYFTAPKDLMLGTSEQLQKSIEEDKEGIKITLKSPVLLKNVYIHTNIAGHLSNNYFDMLPDRTYVVRFTTKSDMLGYKDLFDIMSLGDLR